MHLNCWALSVTRRQFLNTSLPTDRALCDRVLAHNAFRRVASFSYSKIVLKMRSKQQLGGDVHAELRKAWRRP
eukprot:6106235-Pleurochrysis_carterae.AAC.1